MTIVKQIEGQSFSMAFIAPQGDLTSAVSIDSPYQLSSEALGGSYIISCKGTDEVEYSTREIKFDEPAEEVNLVLALQVPQTQFAV